jgi:hypothetical protein
MARVTVHSDVWKDIARELEEDRGIVIHPKQLEEICSGHKELMGEIVADTWGDTQVMDTMADVIARKVTGRDWPTYGEGTDVGREFRHDFNFKGQKHGIRVKE